MALLCAATCVNVLAVHMPAQAALSTNSINTFLACPLQLPGMYSDIFLFLIFRNHKKQNDD